MLKLALNLAKPLGPKGLHSVNLPSRVWRYVDLDTALSGGGLDIPPYRLARLMFARLDGRWKKPTAALVGAKVGSRPIGHTPFKGLARLSADGTNGSVRAQLVGAEREHVTDAKPRFQGNADRERVVAPHHVHDEPQKITLDKVSLHA